MYMYVLAHVHVCKTLAAPPGGGWVKLYTSKGMVLLVQFWPFLALYSFEEGGAQHQRRACRANHRVRLSSSLPQGLHVPAREKRLVASCFVTIIPILSHFRSFAFHIYTITHVN